MSDVLALPFLSEMVPDGLTYGASYLVEFEPHSLWYEASLTLATQAVRHGIGTDYHTYSHIPEEVRQSFTRLGLNVAKLEKDGQLRIIDSYTVTTGLGSPGTTDSGRERFRSRSLDLKDWSDHYLREIKEGAPEVERRRFHLDDNTSVLVQYNTEDTFLDVWRTRGVLWTRKLETANFTSVIVGAHSESLYSKMESLTDGIIDFRSREEHGSVNRYIRMRSLQGKPCDSRWRRLTLSGDGMVTVDPKPLKESQLGIRGWVKGPKN